MATESLLFCNRSRLGHVILHIFTAFAGGKPGFGAVHAILRCQHPALRRQLHMLLQQAIGTDDYRRELLLSIYLHRQFDPDQQYNNLLTHFLILVH